MIAADFDTAAKMLKCVTTPFVITEKVSLDFHTLSLAEIAREPGDEIVSPEE